MKLETLTLGFQNSELILWNVCSAPPLLVSNPLLLPEKGLPAGKGMTGIEMSCWNYHLLGKKEHGIFSQSRWKDATGLSREKYLLKLSG